MNSNEQISEQPNSCEISVNAKGLWAGKIKVYAKTIDEAMVFALKKASELDVLISEKNNK